MQHLNSVKKIGTLLLVLVPLAGCGVKGPLELKAAEANTSQPSADQSSATQTEEQ